jgi:hypothetical protein
MPGTKVNKIKFYSINRDIKEAVAARTYNAVEIGRKHYVSRETVNAVRRAGTWPQWERNRAEANRKRIEKAKAALQTRNITVIPAEMTGVDMKTVGAALKATLKGDEDTVTITRRRFHYFLELERNANSPSKPKRKFRVWRRR